MPEDEADDADAGPREDGSPPSTDGADAPRDGADPSDDHLAEEDPTPEPETETPESETPESEVPESEDPAPTSSEPSDGVVGRTQSTADDESAVDTGSSTEREGGVTAAETTPSDDGTTTSPDDEPPSHDPGVPEDVRTYDRFTKIDGSTYDRANEFLRDRTYVTAREWAIARLCADFRTETGIEMTKIGEHLPELVPFMTDTYSPQAVNQARSSFEEKVRKSGATFLYGAMSDFFTAEELDDVMYEATEVAKFLLEVEGVDLSVEEELEAEDKISEVMREVREHSAALRHDEVVCPECGHEIRAEED